MRKAFSVPLFLAIAAACSAANMAIYTDALDRFVARVRDGNVASPEAAPEGWTARANGPGRGWVAVQGDPLDDRNALRMVADDRPCAAVELVRDLRVDSGAYTLAFFFMCEGEGAGRLVYDVAGLCGSIRRTT